LILKILADIEESPAEGIAFHPAAGEGKPQMFRSRMVNKVISNVFESGLPEGGNSNCHCEGLITLYLILCKVRLWEFNAAAKVAGGCITCKAALNASPPLSINS
jgi:hypothetical protein